MTRRDSVAHPGATPHRRTLLAVAAFLAVTGLLTWREVTHLNIPGRPDDAHWGMQDFRDAVYYPVVALLDGANPYDIHHQRETYPVGIKFPPYSPVTLALHLPLGLLPFEAAEAAYFLLTLVLVLVVARVSLEASGVEPRAERVFALATLVLLTRPGHQNLLVGQVTLEVVLGTYLALRWAFARPWLAGLGVAVATLKPTYGGPLVLLLLARGAFRATAIGVAIGGIVSAVVALVLAHAAGGLVPLLGSLLENLNDPATVPGFRPAESLWRIDTLALVARPLGRSPRALVSGVIGLGVLALAGLAIARLPDDARGRHLFAALACLGILTCTYHQSYDLLLLTMPITMLATGMPLGTSRRAIRGLLLALLALPCANYVVTQTTLDRFAVSHPTWVALASINGASLAVALALYMALAWRSLTARDAVD
jgi:Glycosyltransferase family 87